VGNIGDMGIPIDAKYEGERFEKFKELAKGAKADGSLLVGQVNHPGRQIEARVNPNAISASDVQLGECDIEGSCD
jgi:2,4-dienoyl-CoA reductase-like NADH-dependent reductase (Old Yellow Enzyme family)